MVIPKGVNIFKPEKDGTFRIEIIPYNVNKGKDKPGGNPMVKTGAYYWERTYWIHGGIGADNRPYICLAKTMNKPCPVCEHRNTYGAWKNLDDETREVVKSLFPKERQLFNVLVHGQEDKGVQLWDVSNFLFGTPLKEKIAAADEEDRERYNNFSDPDDGLTLKVAGKMESFNKIKFWKCSDIEFKDRKEEIPNEVLDAAIDLDELIKITPYKELKAIMTQGEADVDEDEDTPDEDDEEIDSEEDEDEDASDDDDSDGDGGDDDEPADEDEEDEDEDDEGEGGDEVDEDEDEDEDEEAFSVGDRVTFMSKKYGKRLKGKVVSLDEDAAKVRVWKDKPPVTVPIGALVAVTEEDDQPPPKRTDRKFERSNREVRNKKSRNGEIPF